MLRWLRKETQTEIEKMRKELTLYSDQIITAVRASTQRPYSTRSTQTVQTEYKERSIQCGVTSLSRVEIRNKK
jgi:hypothetical protein